MDNQEARRINETHFLCTARKSRVGAIDKFIVTVLETVGPKNTLNLSETEAGLKRGNGFQSNSRMCFHPAGESTGAVDRRC